MADSTNSQIGSQTQLSYWDTSVSPDAYTRFANIASFGEFGQDRPEVDVTDLDSTAVERIGGLPDGRTITITCWMNPTTLAAVEDLFDAGETIDLKATFPAPASTSRYFGFFPLGKTIGGTITPNGALTAVLTGRITGEISDTDPHA